MSGTFVVQQTGVVSSGGTALGTYNPSQAVDLVREFLHGYPVENVQARACDIINAWMWTSYPWRWTIKNMPPVALSNGAQDFAGVPSDLLRLLDVRIVRTDVTPNYSRELSVKSYLSPESQSRGFEGINLISYEPAAAIFRLNGILSVAAPTTLALQGRYQFQPPRITDADMDSIFYFPDIYFDVFVEGLKWKFYQLADDTRAGDAAQLGTNIRYTGQMGVFMAALDRMRQLEDYADGQTSQFPDEALGAGRAGNFGLFG